MEEFGISSLKPKCLPTNWKVCGANENGELGLGNTDTPVSKWTKWNSTKKYIAVSSGSEMESGFTVALAEDGSISSWGSNQFGQRGEETSSEEPISMPDINDPFSKISAGPYHAGAVSKSGKIYMWGSNVFGQLGNGNTTDSSSPCGIYLPAPAVDLQCGESHSMALLNDGTVWTWGWNEGGRLGNGKNEDINDEKPCCVVKDLNIVNVWAMANSNIALSANGALWGWGLNQYGELGLGHRSPVPSPTKLSMSKIKNLSVGFSHVIALCEDNTVWSWGLNETGELGIADKSKAYATSPVQLTAPCSVSAVAAFGDGSVFGCGRNDAGQLGLGHTNIAQEDRERGFVACAELSKVLYFGTGCWSQSSFAALE